MSALSQRFNSVNIKKLYLTLLVPPRNFNISQRASSIIFYQRNKKGTDEPPKKLPFRKALVEVIKQFGPETKKFLQEQKEAYELNPMLSAEHGNYEVLYKFNKKAAVDQWIVSTDKDNKGGESSASFSFTKNRTALFHGYLCKEVPKDGITKYAGYANISIGTPKKSFKRETHWDWSLYNCMLLRVRGDGRPYVIVMGCKFDYDVNWLNRWCCPLFTRGGPYWQIAKIPFSKFYISHHGRIQDKQEYPILSLVNSLGITTMDAAEGPFALEIDSISLMYDVNLTGKHAYELYEDKNFEGQN